MLRFTHKEWVRIIDDEALARLREKQKRQDPSSYAIKDAVWRQIEITASDEGVRIELGNVDEQAANGGYCGSQSAWNRHQLTWDDLNDRNGFAQKMRFEMQCVYQQVERMVERLREHMPYMRQVLAQ